MLSAPYFQAANAYRILLANAGFKPDEQARMLYRNAEHFHRICAYFRHLLCARHISTSTTRR